MPGAAQLSYSHGTAPTPLFGETIGDSLRRIAAAHPASEALVDVPSGARWTYAGLDADTDAVALGLTTLGIGKGDRVGIWAPNCAEWVLIQYATAKIGAILVNINPAYRSHELGYVLAQSGVRLLISAERFRTSDYRGMVGEVRDGLTGLEREIYLGTADWASLVNPSPIHPCARSTPAASTVRRDSGSRHQAARALCTDAPRLLCAHGGPFGGAGRSR